eukprot:scaffold19052_cov117-Isochrysis_galbana.AAC.1
MRATYYPACCVLHVRGCGGRRGGVQGPCGARWPVGPGCMGPLLPLSGGACLGFWLGLPLLPARPALGYVLTSLSMSKRETCSRRQLGCDVLPRTESTTPLSASPPTAHAPQSSRAA